MIENIIAGAIVAIPASVVAMFTLDTIVSFFRPRKEFHQHSVPMDEITRRLNEYAKR
jgi:hypothetical protein